MKEWYRSIIAKVILLITAITAPAIGLLSFVLLVGFSESLSASIGDLGFAVKSYEDTDSFQNMLRYAAEDVLEEIRIKQLLETDGAYAPDKLVDVMAYYETAEITGKNESGLAYTVEELGTWEEKENSKDLEEIIVCQKPDETYHYYYMSEFEALLEDGSLKLEMEKESYTQFLEELEEGYYTSYTDGNFVLRDAQGQTVYKTCWTYDGMRVDEVYAPEGAGDLLEIANENPELNGRLSEMCQALRIAAGSVGTYRTIYQSASDLWSEGNTNFTYLFVDEDAKRVYTNNSEFRKYGEAEKNMQAIMEKENYVLVCPKLKDFQSNMDAVAGQWKEMVEIYDALGENYTVLAAVDTAYPIQDVFQNMSEVYNRQIPYVKWSGVMLVFSAVLSLIAIVWLTLIAGRRAGDEKGMLRLNPFDAWKTEAAAAVVIGLWVLMTILLAGNWNGFGYTVNNGGSIISSYVEVHERVFYVFDVLPEDVAVVISYAAATMILFLTGYLSLVRRIKGRTLWKNSLLRMLWHGSKKAGNFLKECWKNRRVTVKAVVILAGFILVHWMVVLTYGYGLFIVLSLAAEIAAAYVIVKNAIAKERMKEGIERIASGDVDHQIPLDGLNGDYYEMAEKINHIGTGLQYAVEKSIRSERLKTDLITNVSHDIKTPLTSIINYVDLLKRENLEDPKIQGYLEVLDKKSQRLKTLTEDVVEASKVSSGNITLEYMDVNLVEMLNQTVGEFSEKMDARQLRVVASLPEEPAMVHVDGRRVWRILENIFNNAAKYAMQGTRVYADLKIENENVVFSLKNVSEQPLNFSSDELTERFIRGDVSRNTEGSGLGLSIAKSLTEMQGGTFELYLDGDLFKVTVVFPRVRTAVSL